MLDEQYSSYSFLLDRTAKRVKQYAQQQFRELGLNITIDQWTVIKNLHENQAMKQNELAEIVNKDNPTLTRIIDLLCNKGFTVRNVHPKDRRSFVVELTQEGEHLYEELSPKVQIIRLRAWEGLTEKDFKQFQIVLNKIYDNLS